MSKESLNFANVSLAHIQENPNTIYALGNGVIPEIAAAFSYDLETSANPANIGGLIGKVGPNETLRDNESIVEATLKDSIPTAKGWMEQAGVMVPANGGLWSPETPTPEDATLIVMGAVPNWTRRTIDHANKLPQTDVIIAAGGRVMESKTDLKNERVLEYVEEFQQVPTEGQYFEYFHKEELEAAGKKVSVLKTKEELSNGIMADLFAQFPELLEKNIAAVRVANAARSMALQLRLAAIAARPSYDSQSEPRIYANSDTFKIASNKEEAAMPAKFQSPVTGARQIPVQAKELVAQKFEK